MPHLQINGVNLYYETAGAGKPTLVLVHGNVASARWWDSVFAPLSEHYAVVRVDLRGCGQSEAPGHGNTVPQYSADVSGLLQALGCDKVVVVGHSLGGSVSMDMAVNHPELVAGLVLVNPAPAEGLHTPDERKPLVEQMIRDRNLMKMALAAVMPTAASGDFFEALVDDAMIAGPTAVSNYTSLNTADYRDRLAGGNVPTRIVYGTLDSLITLDMMERTRDAIPGAELVLYEGIGHSPNVETPERLTEEILSFMEKCSVNL